MAKILKFPSGEEIKQKAMAKQWELEELELRTASDEAIEASQFLLEVMEEFITTGEVSKEFMDMQFRDETFQESRDMFVIVNMLNAMFHRYYGIPHTLHRDFDRLYATIKLMDKTNTTNGEEDDTT